MTTTAPPPDDALEAAINYLRRKSLRKTARVVFSNHETVSQHCDEIADWLEGFRRTRVNICSTDDPDTTQRPPDGV